MKTLTAIAISALFAQAAFSNANAQGFAPPELDQESPKNTCQSAIEDFKTVDRTVYPVNFIIENPGEETVIIPDDLILDPELGPKLCEDTLKPGGTASTEFPSREP